MSGAFVESLKRNHSKIREDRALAIAEAAQLKFKRTVEDLEIKIKAAKRERDNMFDLSPDSADSLRLASNFDEDAFVQERLEVPVKILGFGEFAKERFSI